VAAALARSVVVGGAGFGAGYARLILTEASLVAMGLHYLFLSRQDAGDVPARMTGRPGGHRDAVATPSRRPMWVGVQGR
jgi:hypothetical protein